MSLLLRVLVRLVVLALVVTAYMELVVPLMGDPGDPNIGAGLIAFGIVIVVSFVWSVVDGRRRGLPSTVACWAIVAVALSLGWVVLLAVAERDGSMSTRDALSASLGLVPFTIGLVLVPSLVGAAIGQSLGRES